MHNPLKQLLWKAYGSARLNRMAVRLYARLKPPPYHRDNIEFERDVWNGICTFYADNGRQVGENNTNPQLYHELVPTQHKLSLFEGSSLGRQVNVTALRPMIAIWDDVLQFTALIRNRYLEHRRLADPRFNLQQGYAFSKLGAGMLSYLARRAVNPLKSGTLSPLEASFFTVGVGPFMVVRALMEKGNLAALEPAPLSAAELYALADSSGALLAGNDRACAGSKQLIMQFLDVAMNGQYAKPLNSIVAQRAMARVDNWDELFRYVAASSKLELLVKLNQALCAQQLLALLAGPASLSAAFYRGVQECLRRCYHQTDSPLDNATVLRHFVLIVFALLDELACPEVKKALVGAGLVDDEGVQTPLAARGRAAMIARIHEATAALYPWCRTALEQVNEALGRTSARPVTLADLYRRTAGVDFQPLLAALASE
jgi:hypothetical protein